MNEWRKENLEKNLEVILDYRGKTPKKSDKGIITLSAKSVKMNYIDYSNVYYVSQETYNKFMTRGFPKKGDVLLTTEAPLGCVAELPDDSFCLAQRLLTLRGNPKFLINKYLLYYLQSEYGQHELLSRATGTTVQGIKRTEFSKINIILPPLTIQKKIAKILSDIDEKIKLNNKINDNLEKQCIAIFKKIFPKIFYGNFNVGNYLKPKRGKNLLSKNAILGNIPVVAGGLEPATYHNKSNTLFPVITISASGANAGFIRLWHTPVWSSDSSYIDYSVSKYIYFWYLFFKLRQKEIYDLQSGSAQPHIYPKHLEELSIKKLDLDMIKDFDSVVSSFFEKIGKNNIENKKLTNLKNYLLPKLMNGEIDVKNIEL